MPSQPGVSAASKKKEKRAVSVFLRCASGSNASCIRADEQTFIDIADMRHTPCHAIDRRGGAQSRPRTRLIRREGGIRCPLWRSGHQEALLLPLADGFHIASHQHSQPEVVTVISGTFRTGMGEEANIETTAALKPGNFAAQSVS